MTVYLDRLSAISLLYLLLNPAVRVRCERLYYLRSTPAGAQMLRLCKRLKLLRPAVSPIAWSLGELRDRTGRSLRFRVEEESKRIVDAVRGRLEPLSDALNMEPFARLPRRWVLDYLENGLYGPLRPHIAHFLVAEALARRSHPNGRGPRPVALIRAVPFEGRFETRESRESIRLRAYGPHLFGSVLPAFHLSLEIARALTRACIALVRLPAYGIAARSADAPPSCVAVQYCWGTGTNRRNDLYWHDGDWPPPHRILFYFDRPDAPLTREVAGEMDRRGFRRTVRTAEGCLMEGVPIWRQTPTSVLRQAGWVCRAAWRARRPRGFGTLGEWALGLRCMVGLLVDVGYWKDFFTAHNARLHTNHSALASVAHLAQTLALHLINGCNFRISYSYFVMVDGRVLCAFHAFFAWGACSGGSERFLPYLRRSANLILAGYPFDRYLRAAEKCALLPAPKSDGIGPFVIAAFDEAFGWDEVEYSPRMWRSFYEGLARWVLARRDVFVAFKSKAYHTEQIVEWVPVVGEAIRAGCAAVLPQPTNPFEVAAGADLAIGMGTTTAAVESALYGIPALYYDPTRRNCEQLIDRVSTQLVYRDLPPLLERIGRAIDGADDPNLGSHEEILGEIDAFRDGRAGLRIGNYLRGYLEDIDGGLKREEALCRANRRYAGRWGEDKVRVNRIA